MVEFDAFRLDLATSLLRCADRRRLSHAGGTATGEDIKVIALLERLANDAENLDLHVFLIFELMFTHKRLARRFLQLREDLLAQVGVLYCPSSATDLVRWLTRHTMEDVRQDRPPGSRTRSSTAVPSSPSGTPGLRRGPSDTKNRGLFRSWASDLSAGVGIVAPMLSVWNVRVAFGLMHDRSFVAEHVAVPATVMSVDHVGMGKGFGTTESVVLAFQPTPGATCRVTWHAVSPAFAGAPGETLSVVPRSSACEMPVVPSALGDPVQTFALAAALMAGGLASITLWTWLFRHSPRPIARPVQSPSGDTRDDRVGVAILRLEN